MGDVKGRHETQLLHIRLLEWSTCAKARKGDVELTLHPLFR